MPPETLTPCNEAQRTHSYDEMTDSPLVQRRAFEKQDAATISPSLNPLLSALEMNSP